MILREKLTPLIVKQYTIRLQSIGDSKAWASVFFFVKKPGV